MATTLTETVARPARASGTSSCLDDQRNGEELADLLRLVVEQARAVAGAHEAVACLAGDGDTPRSVMAISSSEKDAGSSHRVPAIAAGLRRLVCEENRSLRLTRAELAAHPEWSTRRGWLAAPLTDPAGGNLGLIQLSDKIEGEFTEQDQSCLEQLARLASVALAQVARRQRAEAAAARYRDLFDHAAEATLVEAADGRLVDANPAALDLLGYARDDLLGRRRRDILDNPATGNGVASLDLLAASGWAGELRAHRRDGAVLPVEARATRIDAATGPFIAWALREPVGQGRPAAPLRRSEAWFRALVQNAHDVITVVAADGSYRFVSPAFEHALGYRPEELTDARQALSLVVDEDKAIMTRLLEAAATAAAGEGATAEFRVRHKDGSIRWREVTATNLLADPVVAGIVYNSRDVTERKRAEAALREAEARYRALVEQIPVVTYTESLANGEALGQLLYVSPQIEGMLGYSVEQWLTDPDLWLRVVHPDDRERMLALTAWTQRTGEPYVAEYRQIARDGRTVWTHCEARLVRDADGRPLHWQGVTVDISDQKQAEAALREAETKYRTLVEQVPAFVYVAAIDGAASGHYVSPQVETMLGYTVEEYLGDPAFWLRTIHPDDRARVLAEAERCRAAGQPFRLEYRKVARDGRVVWIRDEAIVVRDEHGAPLYTQGINFDVTDRKETEASLRAATAAAEQASRLKSAILSAVTHELRTPLSSIQGYLELMLTGETGELAPEQTEFVEIAYKNARHLNTLINDLLDLVRIAAGELDLKRDPVAVAAAVDRVRQVLLPRIVAKGLTLTVDVAPHVPDVLADRERVHQILLHLMTNAVKFTEHGEVAIRVRDAAASPVRDGGSLGEAAPMVAIAISDTGVGIVPEVLPQLFEEFRQADGGMVRRHGGLGLGLAITRKLAELQGGRLMVVSEPGVGSTFTVYLPADRAATR